MTSDRPGSAGSGDGVSLRDLAGTMMDGAEALVRCGHVLAGLDPGPSAFGADAPGQFGEVCRDLRRQWLTALDTRTREAQARADRLAETADAVAAAAAGYLDADADASRALGRAAPEGVAAAHDGTAPVVGGPGPVRPANERWPG